MDACVWLVDDFEAALVQVGDRRCEIVKLLPTQQPGPTVVRS